MSYGYPQQQPPVWSPQPPAMRPTQRDTGWKWVLLGLAVLGCGGVGLCGAGGLWLVSFGMGMMTAEIEEQLVDNQKLREHVGEIQEFKLDWTKSMADDDDDTYVYKVRGSKASGTIKVKHVTDDNGDEQIVWAKLRTSLGQTVDLVP